MKSAPASSITDYLADREGLSGMARCRFLASIDRFYDAFPSPLPIVLPVWPTLLTAVLFAALSVYVTRRWLGSALVLPGLVAAGWRFRARFRLVDLEAEWRIYCVLLRPVLLARHPGLLNRNLPDDRSASDPLVTHPPRTWWEYIRPAWTGLWPAAVAGLWASIAALLCWEAIRGSVPLHYVITLLCLGPVLSPLLWSFWQWQAFRLVFNAAAQCRN